MAVRPLRPATDRRLGALLPHQLANRPQAHPQAPSRALLPVLHHQEPMRACRQFLAGIPHFGPGHPCVTHPSATPSPSVKRKDVRLACVRHAASVYPEPGSNSPSVLSTSSAPPAARAVIRTAVRESRSRPSTSHLALLFADSSLLVSSRSLALPFVPKEPPREQPSLIVLTGTVLDACASLQLLFCFPLFNCQGTSGSKSSSLLCHPPETDKRTQE